VKLKKKDIIVQAAEEFGDDPVRIATITGESKDTTRMTLARLRLDDVKVPARIAQELEDVRQRIVALYEEADDPNKTKIVKVKTDILKVHLQFLATLERMSAGLPQVNMGKDSAKLLASRTTKVEKIYGTPPAN